MDKVSKEVRSKNMAAIKGKDTTPEITVRKLLFSGGYRYRLNVNSLPGKPDIWLKKYNTAIFVNGCFWHQHQHCKFATKPRSNIRFWLSKLKRNVERDKVNTQNLKRLGIKTLIIWECELRNLPKLSAKLNGLLMEGARR
ncbi:MAG: very short patch repair endonuclease [Thermodesulfovibrionales bacterium]|jgi:DNA mismatch endonuclease (patch repair protein)